MKLKHLLFLLLIYSSCNRPKETTVTESLQPAPIVEDSYVYYPIKDNRIKVDLDKPQKASLFDYFSHIELIPLETNDDVLIGYIEEIIHYQNKFYIFDRQQKRVYVFDDTGKFIFQINKLGRGPGEYTYIRSIFLNPFTRNIDILGLGFIYSYDLSGKHVRTSQQLVNPPIYPFNLIALNEKTYVFYSIMSSGFNSYRIYYYDMEEAKIFHQEYEVDDFFNTYAFLSLDFHTRFYEHHGKWFFSHFVDNVTYEVGPDSLTKAYTWDFGRHNYDPGKLDLPNAPSSISTLPYRIIFQEQNNRYLMALIALRKSISNALVFLMYDKSTNECKYIERFTESVDFLPRKVSNEYVLSWCSHRGVLENYVSEEMLDETNLQKFKDLMNAEEEMNPIVIKYYFK
jgi:hypothetical protein